MDLNVLCCKSDNEIIDEIGMGNLPLITHALCKKYNGKYKPTNIQYRCKNINNIKLVIFFIGKILIYETITNISYLNKQ